ncbi:hypothetical protein OPQ81_000335 [Rhizoctonia solani]|nr:hypothetical protein OPQ81_000335 [Rhizoctonia solani]
MKGVYSLCDAPLMHDLNDQLHQIWTHHAGLADLTVIYITGMRKIINQRCARGAKSQSSPQQASTVSPSDVNDDHVVLPREGGQSDPVDSPSVDLYQAVLCHILTILLCAMSVLEANLTSLDFCGFHEPSWSQPTFIYRKVSVRAAHQKIAMFVSDIVGQFWSTVPDCRQLLPCFREITSFGFPKQWITGFPAECSTHLRGLSTAAHELIFTYGCPLVTSSKVFNFFIRCVGESESDFDHPFRACGRRCAQIVLCQASSGLKAMSTGPGVLAGTRARVQSAISPVNDRSHFLNFLPGIEHHSAVYLPTFRDYTLKPHTKTEANENETNKLGLREHEKMKIFGSPEIGERVERAQVSHLGECIFCHSGAYLFQRSVAMAVRRPCPMLPRLSRRKHPKLQSSIVFSPPRFLTVYSMTGVSLVSTGVGDTATALGFREPSGPNNCFNSASRVASWPGEDSSSEQLHEPGLKINCPHTPRGRFEPVQNEPAGTPSPPLPLPLPPPTNTKCDEHKLGWNVGFTAGCVFATRASGPQSGVSQLQPDPAGSTTQVSPVHRFVNCQSKEYETGWYAGFVAGCEFAARTSGESQSRSFQTQPNPTEPTRRVLSLSPAPLTTPTSNDDGPPRPGIDLGIPITSSIRPGTSGGEGNRVGNNEYHDQPGLDTTRIPTETSIRNGVQSNAVSTSQALPRQEAQASRSGERTSLKLTRVHLQRKRTFKLAFNHTFL